MQKQIAELCPGDRIVSRPNGARTVADISRPKYPWGRTLIFFKDDGPPLLRGITSTIQLATTDIPDDPTISVCACSCGCVFGISLELRPDGICYLCTSDCS